MQTTRYRGITLWMKNKECYKVVDGRVLPTEKASEEERESIRRWREVRSQFDPLYQNK